MSILQNIGDFIGGGIRGLGSLVTGDNSSSSFGTGAQSLLGLGMMGYGASQMANPSINQGYLSSLNL